ncbi:GNAT family N-acetyltransferase [Shewanella salipaludis]|uniref:GNAT family N-acetyltransferase n=1 Tax=Shewanella salipaludis TaxID=2723052 RepID=A0A972JIM5_9GAMM|nr:GNAT family N-acetyltransferase [Shewanella salipaludis]NMH64265.1 GNAT family N-acetyltransferase [Shewanella salipaludis]
MAWHIAQATPGDSEEIAGLFNEYRIFYGKADEPARARQFIEMRLQEASSVIFIATDNQGSGLGFAQLYPSFSSLKLAPILILNDLFVAQHARCVGIGRALLQAVIAYAGRHGVAGIMLETEQHNLRAQGLYEALGFARNDKYFVYELDIAS